MGIVYIEIGPFVIIRYLNCMYEHDLIYRWPAVSRWLTPTEDYQQVRSRSLRYSSSNAGLVVRYSQARTGRPSPDCRQKVFLHRFAFPEETIVAGSAL